MRIEAPGGRALDLGEGRTRLMGVLNLTPDSFSDGGLFDSVDAAVRRGLELVDAGADVLDLGGESTRPHYRPVPPQTQMERVLPVLEALRPRVPVPISLAEDPEMAAVVATHGCPVVLMHRFDPPRTAADPPPSRGHVMAKIVARLRARIAHATASGIRQSRILLDPGVGFGTLSGDNPVIHAHVEDLRILEKPLVVGPSRKSFLGQLTGRPTSERLAATAACVAALALRGVEIVRVHDVAAMRDVVAVADAIRRAGES
jgi:dihydropteroate synthase